MKIIFSLCLYSLFISQSWTADYPESNKIKVVTEYHGIAVEENYRWLENWDNKAVKEWSKAQNITTRNYLDQLPYRQQLSARIEQIKAEKIKNYFSATHAGERAYFFKNQPSKQQALLVEVSLTADQKTERIIFDPNEVDKSGATTIDWYRISPDGKLVALALSKNGSEVSNLHIVDIMSGKQVDHIIPRVNAPTAGGDIAWLSDSSGFYYTRYPRVGERGPEDMNFYQQLWFHKLGSELIADRYEIGREFPRIAELGIRIDRNSGQLLVNMQYGDSGQFQLHLKDNDGKWRQISDYDNEVVQAEFVNKDTLLVLSRKNAPRGKFLLWDLSSKNDVSETEIVPQSDVTLASDFWSSPTFIVHHKHIYATVIDGGPSYVRVFNLQGERLATPPIPELSGIGQLAPWGANELMIRQYSNLTSNKWLRLNVEHNEVLDTAFSSYSTVDFADATVVREFAVSKDGTKVPVTIIHPKGIALNASHPVLLTGYGGYGISLKPHFLASRKVWLEQGGIIAIANLRGGGEYGEDWHRQGMLTKKQNVFDDFAGVMSHLIKRRYTKPTMLAIEGGSNGGLLMGAMITQHPGLFAVTISHVGIYDMLRSELEANGEFNIPEFGTVKDEAQFKALHAYSPYHHVETGTHYPAILFMTGENDGRVDPLHSRKMTAALQAANASKNPILLRTSSSTGHGSGTPLSEGIKQDVDRFSFLFATLGIKYQNAN